MPSERRYLSGRAWLLGSLVVSGGLAIEACNALAGLGAYEKVDDGDRGSAPDAAGDVPSDHAEDANAVDADESDTAADSLGSDVKADGIVEDIATDIGRRDVEADGGSESSTGDSGTADTATDTWDCRHNAGGSFSYLDCANPLGVPGNESTL